MQTSGALNTVNGNLQVSADGLTWIDISGSTNKLAAPTQTADTGEAATLDGQYMIGTAGKLKPMDLDVVVVYTENSNEANDFFTKQMAKSNRPVYVRWSPKNTLGSKRYYTANSAGVLSAGVITAIQYPGADATVAAPALLTFKVRTTTVGVGSLTPSASMSPSASLSPSASASASASASVP